MKRILVVDDSQELLELFRLILASEDHEVTLASHVIEDTAEIARIQPDLIILDFFFRGRPGAGRQMLHKLKSSQATASIPLIICTAAEREVAAQQAYLLSEGISVLFKPFDIDVLVDIVDRALRVNHQEGLLVQSTPSFLS